MAKEGEGELLRLVQLVRAKMPNEVQEPPIGPASVRFEKIPEHAFASLLPHLEKSTHAC